MELPQKLIFLGYLAADVLLASAFIVAVLVACPYCVRSTPGSEDPAIQKSFWSLRERTTEDPAIQNRSGA